MTDDLDDTDYPRARPLTCEELRAAYRQPMFTRFFATLAKTRLEMLDKQQQHESPGEKG